MTRDDASTRSIAPTNQNNVEARALGRGTVMLKLRLPIDMPFRSLSIALGMIGDRPRFFEV
jgi:hypothetical protein